MPAKKKQPPAGLTGADLEAAKTLAAHDAAEKTAQQAIRAMDGNPNDPAFAQAAARAAAAVKAKADAVTDMGNMDRVVDEQLKDFDAQIAKRRQKRNQ